MAVKEKPPRGLLASFSAPLWERLGLVGLRPQWIVKGQHRGYDWMAIELDHRPTGMLQTTYVTTTVFVVRLPRQSKDWYLPSHRITPERQVCVDDACVYAAALGQQPRVRTWLQWLDLAVDAAEEVQSTEGMRPAENSHTPTAANPQTAEPERTWNPNDANVVIFWLMGMLPISFFALWGLVEAYSDWHNHGAIIQCHPKTHMGTYLQGWKAVAYAGLLLAPLPGVLKMAHTMVTRYHRPNFALIHLEGVLLVGASYGLFHALQALSETVRRAC